MIVKAALQHLRERLISGGASSNGGFLASAAGYDDHYYLTKVSRECGCPHAIIKAMNRHSFYERDINTLGCWVLGYMAAAEEVASELLKHYDSGVDAIVQAMERFPRDNRLQHHACFALRNILTHAHSSNSTYVEAVVRCGGIVAITNALKRHGRRPARNPTLVVHAFYALNVAADTRKGSQAIIRCGGVSLLSPYAKKYESATTKKKNKNKNKDQTIQETSFYCATTKKKNKNKNKDQTNQEAPFYCAEASRIIAKLTHWRSIRRNYDDENNHSDTTEKDTTVEDLVFDKFLDIVEDFEDSVNDIMKKSAACS